jgi:PilZ domain
MELRQHPRVRVAFPAVACLGETAISVDAVDVSSGGIAVTSDRRLVLGSDVRVSWFSGDGTPAEVDAVVVRVERVSSSVWLWGLAVHGFEPTHRRLERLTFPRSARADDYCAECALY